MSLLSVNKKGKWVVGGVIAFALIATASTGLAAWVIGMQTGDNTNGTITVDEKIVDQSIDVTLGECETKIHFGPDSVGNPLVNADSQDTADLVDLQFTIAGTVTWGTDVTVSGINVDIVYPEDVLNSEYITIPTGFDDAEVNVDHDKDKETPEVSAKRYIVNLDSGATTSANFSKVFKFEWKKNPCTAYTTNAQINEAKTAIETLKTYNNQKYYVFVSAIFTNNA